MFMLKALSRGFRVCFAIEWPYIYGGYIYDEDDLLYTNIIASAILECVLSSMLLIYNNNNNNNNNNK